MSAASIRLRRRQGLRRHGKPRNHRQAAARALIPKPPNTGSRISTPSGARPEDAVHVDYSTGGGEVARCIGRHGTGRVAKAVLIGAVPPPTIKAPANPGGTPRPSTRSAPTWRPIADRTQFLNDLGLPYYGYTRAGAKVSEGVRESFWLQERGCEHTGRHTSA